jgi:thymidylate synthase
MYSDFASAHRGILRTLLANGTEIALGDSASIGANRTTLDISNYQLVISNPIKRILPKHSAFNFVRALARFLWLASANDRLSDIEVYDPGAANFSDDGLKIPGSNFGQRLFCPRPGLNPIARLIELLKREPDTRRGSVPIFFSEDVARDSKDIPCALAVHLRVIAAKLCMTVLMRSNNGFRLFPYNGFEFSLLQEAIARHLQVEVGTYTHYAISMHIYSEDIDLAKECCEHTPSDSQAVDFALMPQSPAPLEQIVRIANLESKFRDAFIFGGSKKAHEIVSQASDSLCDYWQSYFLRLTLALSEKGGYVELADEIASRLAKLSVSPFFYNGINLDRPRR